MATRRAVTNPLGDAAKGEKKNDFKLKAGEESNTAPAVPA